MTRYRIYDAHKLVTSTLSDFSSFVAKADFSVDKTVEKIKTRLTGITQLIHGHANHEDERIHPLLKQKGSSVFEQIEQEHQRHGVIFSALHEILNQTITSGTDKEARLDYGRQFYLEFQRFEAHNLLHQIYEETVIMTELHKLYTDEELSALTEAITYQKMTDEQIAHMLTVLFPQYNPDDREATLIDLKHSTPEKFIAAWTAISPLIEEDERVHLMDKLGVNKNNYSEGIGKNVNPQ